MESNGQDEVGSERGATLWRAPLRSRLCKKVAVRPGNLSVSGSGCAGRGDGCFCHALASAATLLACLPSIDLLT